MRYVKLAAGLAAGYVLGARAGRERYEQIAATARKVRGAPAVTEEPTTVAVTPPTPAVVADKPRRPRNRRPKAATATTGESSALSTADLHLDSIPLEASEADVIEQHTPLVDRGDEPPSTTAVLESDATDAREQRRS